MSQPLIAYKVTNLTVPFFHMIQTFLVFEHFVTLLEPNDFLDFYHYETLQQEYLGKPSDVPCLVLKNM